MSKLTTYLIVITGILILFHYTGIIGEGEGSLLLNLALNPQNIRQTAFSRAVEVAITAAVATGIIIGTLISRNFEIALLGTTSLLVWNLFTDLIIIYNKLASLGTLGQTLGVIFLGVPILLFGIVIVDWWLGRG